MTATLARTSVVQVERFVRRYGATTAVDDISFEVRPGEMFGLIGPDGAGKTTTLRAVLGLLGPSAGQVRSFGLDPLRHRRQLASRVGYLSQRFSIYGDLTIDENIAFFAEAHGVRGWRPRRDELLERLRLLPFRTRLADRLSGGMKQKLALACTLVHTPELLVLDEPTTGVDPVSRREFWRILSELQQEGLSLLLTTPYLDEAERCNRVGLIDRGRLLGVDTPTALRQGHGTVLIELIARPRRRAQEIAAALPLIGEVEVFGERMHLALRSEGAPPSESPVESIRVALADAGISIESLRLIEPSLEDLFIARLRGLGHEVSAGPAGAGAGPSVPGSHSVPGGRE